MFGLQDFKRYFKLAANQASLVAQIVKNPPANAGDLGSIPGVRIKPLEKGMATHSSILAWEIPWAEELCGLESTGSQGWT